MLDIELVEELASKINILPKDLIALERKIPSYYKKTRIPKHNNGEGLSERTIYIPKNPLKKIQRTILKNILKFEFPIYVTGGIKGRSIVDNAKPHMGQKWLLCLDLQDFFPSIHFTKIHNCFISLNCSPKIAKALTHFTTYKFQLPQGVPTSTTIANMVLYSLDKRVFNLCKYGGFKYSRFVDDITISGPKNPKYLLDKCKKIVTQEGFKINLSKVKITPPGKKKLVTGIVVDGERLKPSQKELNKIKEALDRLSSKDFSMFSEEDPSTLKKKIRGHISFIKSFNHSSANRLEQKFKKIYWDNFCC